MDDDAPSHQAAYPDWLANLSQVSQPSRQRREIALRSSGLLLALRVVAMRAFPIVVLASALAVGGCSRRGLANDAPDLGGVGAGDGADLGDADLGGDDMVGGGPPDLAGPPDMTPPPSLIPSDIKYYYGTTSDGWSVVVPGYYAAGPAWALRLADGTALLIVDQQFDAWTDGDLVFVEYNVSGGYGKLAVWRQGGPAVVLADDMLAIGPRPLSDGAGHISYYLPAGYGGAGLLCFDTVDHAGSRCLDAPFADVAQNGTCTPKARLSGGRLLVQHCPWPVLNPPTKNVLSSYDLAGTADVDLATDALFFDSAPNVGVLVTSRSGALNLVAADGSGTLTTTPLVTDAKSATFTPDGKAALVVTVSNALERVDLASGAVTVLQTSGGAVAHVSNDGNFATYRTSTDLMTGRGDLWLSDARNAGTTAVALVPTTTAYFTFGHAFTSDSAFVVYLADAADPGVGSLRARSIAGGSERAIGTGSFPATPVGGSRIVFTENANTSGVPALGDLSFVDLASGAAPTKIATQAYAWYQVMSDGTLVYLQPGEGLHAVKLP
jgi:hypothetical protein